MRPPEAAVVSETCQSCGADLTGYKTFCAACGTTIGEKSTRVRPPRRSNRTTGAAWWVLIAIGLIILDRIVNRDQWMSLSDWLLAASITLAWLFAALNARKGFGRVILWIILLVNVFVWVVLVGLFTSPALQNVGEDAFIGAVTESLREAGVNESTVDCVASDIAEGGYAQGLDSAEAMSAFLLAGGPSDLPPEFRQAVEGYLSAAQRCLSVPENLELFGVAGSPQTFGDNPHFDALWNRCETGDLIACDLLNASSVIETEYQEYGRSCGNRSDPEPEGQLCIFLHGGGPDFDQLRDECLNGDFVACDGLFGFSDIGSGYDQLGVTCGGRIAEPAPDMVGACFLRFEVDS